MELKAVTGSAGEVRSDCVLVGVFESRELTDAARQLDRRLGRRLGNLLRRGDFAAKLGETQLLPELSSAPAQRVLLVGLGARKELDDLVLMVIGHVGRPRQRISGSPGAGPARACCLCRVLAPVAPGRQPRNEYCNCAAISPARTARICSGANTWNGADPGRAIAPTHPKLRIAGVIQAERGKRSRA